MIPIDYHIDELQKGFLNMEMQMAKYEKQYRMTTKEFYNRFISNNLEEHNEDFLSWSGIYEIWLENKNDLEEFAE